MALKLYINGESTAAGGSGGSGSSNVVTFTGCSVTWTEDETYADFPFKGTIEAEGIDDTFSADVRFSSADSRSGIFASWCDTGDGEVYIYAWDAPSEEVTIPMIVCTK